MRWAACAALSLLSLGCEGLSTVANPEVPLWVNHPGNAMSVSVSREITAESRQIGEPYERGRPAIDPVHRRIFVGSRDHGLYALNAVDLVTLWRFETGGAVQSEPLYDLREDVVYFGSYDGALYKLRAADGKMIWRFASNAEISEQPVLYRGTLFVTNANDTLIALDPATGKLRWYQHREPAAGMEIAGHAGPAVFADKVYTAFSDGVVMAYRVSDGAEAWPILVDLAADAAQTRGEDIRYFDVDTTPIVSTVGETPAIFVASYEGGVYALDAQTGGRLWNNDGVTGVTQMMLYEAPAKPRRGEAPGARTHRVLVASSGLTGLWGLSTDDGEEGWRRDLPAGGITRAEPWAGALLVGTTRFGLFLIHPLDGGVIDGLYQGGSFAVDPAAYGKHAFVMSNEGVLFGLTIAPPG